LIDSIEHSVNPEAILGEFLHDGKTRSFTFDCHQPYLPGSPVIRLLAVLVNRQSSSGDERTVLISDRIDQAMLLLSKRPSGDEARDDQALLALSTELEAPVLTLTGAIRLNPIEIPKPWGREIWYTGIEERGQSGVGDGQYQVPLPWLLALSPSLLLNTAGKQVNLLKILDPLPEEVFGDLYFELHEEKQEVYVVTNVDRSAWPDGRGAIRFGFNQEIRKKYHNDDAFRRAYLDAVAAYGRVRREIDALLDHCRTRDSVGLNAPVQVDTLKRWLETVPEVLKAEELDRRQAMNSFTAMLPLQVGDVVKVPCLTPHALQHGVRTIEFQTPVYERKILSFAQKVLTQGHWDTEDAARLMSIEPPEIPALKVLEQSSGLVREQVVLFDDFVVQRLTLPPAGSWLPPATDRYRVIIVVTGEVSVSELQLGAEQAAILPACALSSPVKGSPFAETVLLVSEPL